MSGPRKPGSQSKRERREAAQRRAKRKRLRTQGITALVIAVAVIGVVSLRGGGEPAIAADFELETLEGNSVTLSEFTGRPVAVTFMHSW